jgi:hypothetical protein
VHTVFPKHVGRRPASRQAAGVSIVHTPERSSQHAAGTQIAGEQVEVPGERMRQDNTAPAQLPGVVTVQEPSPWQQGYMGGQVWSEHTVPRPAKLQAHPWLPVSVQKPGGWQQAPTQGLVGVQVVPSPK